MLLVTPSLELALGAVAFLTPVAPRPTPIAPDTTKASSPNLPLAASRSFALSTSKGTWISLDLSPDGRTIVFDLLGDLYTIPAQGGRATRLTSGLAYDAQPRFSPDGKRIVFVSDRSGVDNLWLMSVDGRDTTQLTKDKTPSNTHYLSPEWTPDGKGIVATKESDTGGPGKLWLYDPDGGTGLELVGAPPANRMLGAAFGPDSRYVWYATRAGAFDYNAIFPLWQVAVYDRASGTRTVMTSRYGSGFRPALSPDGKWLTYGSRQGPNTGLILRELATGPEKWLAYPIQRDEQESFAPLDLLPGYSFTADSRALVMSYGGEIWRVPLDGSAAAKIPVQVDEQIAMGPEVRFVYRVDTSASLVAREVRDAVPSPDGKRLAFSALDRVWVMEFPGGTPRRVSNLTVHEHGPVWSPDGSSLAFVTWSDRDGGHVYRASPNPEPRTATRLTATAARYSQLAWSPDGQRIVAVRVATRDMQETRSRMLRPETDYSLSWLAQGMADIVAAGGYGAIGAHGKHNGLGSHWETWSAGTALGPMGALEVASLHGARFIGKAQDLGSIEVGKLADFMVLNSDPLVNITNTADIAFVVKNGVVYDDETLDELWPRQRKYGPYYWVVPDALKQDDKPLRPW